MSPTSREAIVRSAKNLLETVEFAIADLDVTLANANAKRANLLKEVEGLKHTIERLEKAGPKLDV
jgi:hypothetical protein